MGFLDKHALAEDEPAASVVEGRADAGFGIRAEAAVRGEAFRARAARMGGCDTAATGAVAFDL